MTTVSTQQWGYPWQHWSTWPCQGRVSVSHSLSSSWIENFNLMLAHAYRPNSYAWLKMWVVAALFDTISKNMVMIPQTSVNNWKLCENDHISFLKKKALRARLHLAIPILRMGLGNISAVFRSQMSSGIFRYFCHYFCVKFQYSQGKNLMPITQKKLQTRYSNKIQQ